MISLEGGGCFSFSNGGVGRDFVLMISGGVTLEKRK